jgi:hypothetical protein
MSDLEPLSEENIAELAEFFNLLARFDYEGKIRAGEGLDK